MWNPDSTITYSSFEATVFTPELEEGIATTDAALSSSGAPTSLGGGFGLYVSDFATGSDRYVGLSVVPDGASTDLSHVVFGGGAVSEWVDGQVVPVSVTNEGAVIQATVGSQNSSGTSSNGDLWHAVSSNGSRVYFSSPLGAYEGAAALYLRENAEQPQSPLTVHGEASGTGTVTAGSPDVTSLVVGATAQAEGKEGSTEVTTDAQSRRGKFSVGDSVAGAYIEPETTITALNPDDDGEVTLSKPIIGSGGKFVGFELSDIGPAPFAVGQRITGGGIPPGTTITEAKAGELTLSKLAGSSGSDVALHAGGECTVPADACTIEVSASQRLRPNPAGTQSARYRGASADGSRVFFTSNAELTEDAYTGTSAEDSAANLYEYDLATGKLNDLTGETVDSTGNGAAVQGVAQISEDGSYVYFVADGVLTKEPNARGERASQGSCLPATEQGSQSPAGAACNLYLAHDGETKFIATLAKGDEPDWSAGSYTEAGPEINTAVVNPGGTRLAFLSTNELTGYDNHDANTGEPDAEIFLYEAGDGGLVCASCNPTGARPVGPSSFVARGTASFAQYRPRNLLADGTLFFDSSDALVPHASDGRRNVYEFQDGHVSCDLECRGW